MNKKRRLIKLLCYVTMLCMTPSIIGFFSRVDATFHTINESEPNDTYQTADTTFDDFDNFGTMSSASDVDWWKITFSSEGIANFWLGSIPSGCNYDLSVYNSAGTLIASSSKSSNSSEYAKVHVRTGYVYYAKVYVHSGSTYDSSDTYKMRIKNYDLGSANLFTFDYAFINTHPIAQLITPYLNNMGISSSNWQNKDVFFAYDKFPSSDIFLFAYHANKGVLQFSAPTSLTHLYAKNTALILATEKEIDSYSSSALSDVKCALLIGCLTGGTSDSYGNLVDKTLSKGAFTAIGFNNSISLDDAKLWAGKLFYYCASGYNVGQARALTHGWVYDNYSLFEDPDSITSLYTGSKSLYALNIGYN